VPRGAGVLQRPDERRLRVEIVRQLGEADVIGVEPRHDLAADAPHRAVVVAEKVRLHLLLSRGPVLGPRPHQRDVAADVLAQQLLRLEQVVFVVLLRHGEPRRLGQRAEVDRRRVHGRGNVPELEIEPAGRELDVPDVAHEGDARVVHRHPELDLIVQRRRTLAERGGGRRTGRGSA
jgi:hypothetical protein